MNDTFQLKLKNVLTKEFQAEHKIKNINALPRLVKVVINVGEGEGATNKKILEFVQSDLAAIAGQKPVVTLAKKSVSAFKIRRGLPVGVKVTLRGEKMYSFLEKLFAVVLPRIRDFRGLPASTIDSHGNFSLGLSDQTLFPEIEYDKIDRIRGLQVTIVVKNSNKEISTSLFKNLKVPFLAK